MQRLRLEYGEVLQGNFQPGKLNLLFAFQVNCPGCFFYGFPLMDELELRFKEKINLVAMSTAFEDFDINTLENTRLLLDQGQLVGETKKAYLKHKLTFDIQPHYPVLMDKFSRPDLFLQPAHVERICTLNPNYAYWPTFERELFKQKVKGYYIKYPTIGHTFHLNQFRGTPTFVVFNEEYDILDTWFGHKAIEEVVTIIDKWI